MDFFFPKVIELLNTSISEASKIFSRFFVGRWLSLFLSVFAIIVIFRTIIYPLIGVSGSDGVIGEEEKEKRFNENRERRRNS